MFCYNARMSLWHKLLYWLGLRRDPGPHYYEVSASLHATLSELARRSGKPEEALAKDLLASGLNYYSSRDSFWEVWKALTPREQDVTALTCLGYTNRQIAAALGIAVETVKTHIANALRKFSLRSKADLRVALAEWNFNAWRTPRM